MPPKRNVAFIKPDEPAFLKRMKAQIGWQEPDTIDAKVRSLKSYQSDFFTNFYNLISENR